MYIQQILKLIKNRENAMDVEEVIEKIYQSFLSKEKTLIIDGRKSKVKKISTSRKINNSMVR